MTDPSQCATQRCIPELLEEGRLKIRQQQHSLTARAGARRATETVNVRLAVGEADLQDERDAGVVDACWAGVGGCGWIEVGWWLSVGE